MNILEKTLEDIIFETDNKFLNERGLPINGKKKRQVKIGNYGIADLISCERSTINGYGVLQFTIYELKQNSINPVAFWQAIRYARGLQNYLNNYKPLLLYKIHIALIGTSIDEKGEFVYLPDLFIRDDIYTSSLSVEFYIMKLNIDGILFEQKYGYSLINDGF